jgi:hypothetical protein
MGKRASAQQKATLSGGGNSYQAGGDITIAGYAGKWWLAGSAGAAVAASAIALIVLSSDGTSSGGDLAEANKGGPASSTPTAGPSPEFYDHNYKNEGCRPSQRNGDPIVCDVWKSAGAPVRTGFTVESKRARILEKGLSYFICQRQGEWETTWDKAEPYENNWWLKHQDGGWVNSVYLSGPDGRMKHVPEC